MLEHSCGQAERAIDQRHIHFQVDRYEIKLVTNTSTNQKSRSGNGQYYNPVDGQSRPANQEQMPLRLFNEGQSSLNPPSRVSWQETPCLCLSKVGRICSECEPSTTTEAETEAEEEEGDQEIMRMTGTERDHASSRRGRIRHVAAAI